MGKHSGGRRAGPSAHDLVVNAGGAVLTALAWGVLVFYAIQLGPSAKAGELAAWSLMLVATLGAVACLFLALIFGGRLYELVRGQERPRVLPGGRRARR